MNAVVALTNRDEELMRLRTPPHSLEAEQSLLGGLLLDNQGWDRVADLVAEGDFYRLEHRRIFAAIGRLILACKPADVITVHDALVALEQARDGADLAYLNALAQSVPSAANARRYAEIVRERAVMRQLLHASDDIATAVLSPQGRSAQQVLDMAESKVMGIQDAGARGTQGFQNMGPLLVSFVDRLSALAERGPSAVTGRSTGLVDLDGLTAGLQPGELIVVAARPSMGKTALAMNFAEHVAVAEGLPVLAFSMEMSAGQLVSRMVGAMARVDQSLLRTGQLHDDDWSRLTEAIERLNRAKIEIDETPALTVGEVRARARRQARVMGEIGLIVVDYLQLMSASAGSDGETRATALGEITSGLKGLAKELRCPVVALSQLNRAVEGRNDKRPMLSDLRESGAIEQDADVVMFIYRDEYYTKDECTEPGVAEIIVAKQRNGAVGTVKTLFAKQHTKFVNLAHAGA